jgi:hypothetical protein
MSYNLCMSAAQIARCNRALGSNRLSITRINRTWLGVTTQEDVVVLTAEGIREVIAALRNNPESTDSYRDEEFADLSLEDLNLAYMDRTLELVLEDAEDPNMLFGVCL